MPNFNDPNWIREQQALCEVPLAEGERWRFRTDEEWINFHRLRELPRRPR